MRVLGIIPARGGSKGVPRKNIRLLNGRPLLEYTAEAALSSRRLSRVILSTEDDEVASIGRACGLDVPFMRPAELASDTAPTFPVIQNALETLGEMGCEFDAVCVLQPTCPLRSSLVIDSCVDLLECTRADTVVTVSKVPLVYNPNFVYFSRRDGSLEYALGGETKPVRRQDVDDAFVREGSVYLTATDTIFNKQSLFGEKIVGFEIDATQSVNIDNEEDWAYAESVLRSRREDSCS